MKTWFMLLALLVLSGNRVAAFEYVDLPEGCWQRQKFPCSLRAVRTLKKLKMKSSVLAMPADTSIKLVSASRLQLLTGYVWIQEADSFEILIEGQVAVLSGDVLVSKEDQRIVLQNMSGTVDFRSTRVFASEAVPVGFENWYSKPGPEGEISRGIANLFSVESVFKKIAPLMEGDKEQQVKNLSEFRKAWSGRAEMGAQFYQEVVQRRLAVAEEKRQKKADEKTRRDREDQRLRQMFRAKNYMDQ